MKLFGVLAAFNMLVVDATRDRVSYSEFRRDPASRGQLPRQACRSTMPQGRQAPDPRLARRLRLHRAPLDHDAQLRELHSLGWPKDGRPLVLIGQTGVGKSFISQAIALQVCQHGRSALYFNSTTWLGNLALACSSGTYLRYRDKLAKLELLVSGAVGMRKLTAADAQGLCEIPEER